MYNGGRYDFDELAEVKKGEKKNVRENKGV